MLYIIISVLVVLADQAVKYLTSANIAAGEIVEFIPGVIHLTYLENTGAAFSMLADKRWLLTGISGICAILLLIILIKYKMRPIGRISVAAVLGGAVGNLIDRALFGGVVDMFEVEFMDFAVFNVADIFITVGGVVFCIYYIVDMVKSEKQAKAKKLAAEQAAAEASAPVSDTDEWSEEKILQEYDIERLLSEYHSENDNNG